MIRNKARYPGLRAQLLGMTALTGFCAATLLPAADASAAGFALKEQSSSAQGNSFAGATAGAEDVTYMFFNPAGLTRLDDEHQAALVVSYILPQAELQGASGRDLAGAPVTGTTTGDAGEGAIVPAAYFLWSLSPDLKLGLGVNAPFGLKTEYDTGWVGRYHATESELKTININPNVAYRLNERISVGAGLQIQYVEATLSQAIDINTISGGAVPADGSVEVTGDDWGYGFNLGVLFELSESTRIGAAYRSKISSTLKGTGDFTLPGGATPADFLGAFADTGVSAKFTSPDTASVGVYHDLSPELAVMAEAAWTGWSSFDVLRVQFDNPVQPDSVTIEDWDDSWFFALGATWRPNEQLALRGGIAYDQTPIPDATRTPRIPGNDRTWVSLGLGYEVTPGFSLDAGYTHIFVDDSAVTLNQGGSLELNASYENSVDIVTVQAVLKF